MSKDHAEPVLCIDCKRDMRQIKIPKYDDEGKATPGTFVRGGMSRNFAGKWVPKIFRGKTICKPCISERQAIARGMTHNRNASAARMRRAN